MWVCLNDAFLSIVADRDNDDLLVVRARIAGDIERVFPSASGQVKCTPVADYLYRVHLPRQVVANAIGSRAFSVNYPNFKNSVQDAGRHRAYEQFWTIMVHLQDDCSDQSSRHGHSNYQWWNDPHPRGTFGDDR